MPFFIVWQEYDVVHQEHSVLAARQAFASRKEAEDGVELLAEMTKLAGRPSCCIREADTPEDAAQQVAGLPARKLAS